MNDADYPTSVGKYSATAFVPRLKCSVLLIAVLVLAGNSISGIASANSLEAITYSTLPGNRLQIALQLSGPASKPRGFTITNPARISLDLADTINNLPNRVVPLGVGIARTINTAEAAGRTRVVINLASLVTYETLVDGNTIYITFNAEAADSTAIGSRSVIKTASASGSTGQRAVTDIDFRRGPGGEGRVLFTLSESGIPMDINESNGNIVVDFLATDISGELIRRLDVLDFATPVRFVDSFKFNDNVRIVIEPISRDFEQLAYQSDNIVTIELKPVLEEELLERAKKKFGYTGERLSLNFQDIEVRSVLQLLADFTDLNIVVSDTVTGKLTLRLKNVPWDQALDIILKTKALDKRESGNVLLVAPTEEIAARERVELEALQQVEELAPLSTEFMQINYAKAADLAAILQAENGSILSERGSVAVDERTNTLLINDTTDKLTEIRGLMNRLDIPVKQVLIESRIVVANDDFTKDIGVRFGVNRTSTTGVTDGSVVAGSTDTVSDLINQDQTAFLGSNDRFNVNFPAPTGAASFALALATLPFGTLLELELSAMQAEARGEVISSPRLITASQNKAYIEQGVEIPFLEASSSGAATVSFRKAVLSLEVTPQITPDSRIIMDLVVKKDTVGELFSPGNGVEVPSIDTREVATQVLVNNGDTVVLGGVYEQTVLN